MLHQDFGGGLTREGDTAREQLVQHDAEAVDIDLGAVLPARHFGSHVVDGSDTLRVRTATVAAKFLRQADIAHLHRAVLAIDVGRFEIAMDDPAFVQMRDARRQTGQPIADLIERQAVRESGEDIFETRPVDVLHHDPGLTV